MVETNFWNDKKLGLPLTRGDVNVVVDHQPELKVFPEDEQKSLDEFGDEEFLRTFAPYQTLLIRKSDRTVIAAITDGFHDELVRSFVGWLDEHEHDERLDNLSDFASWPGPRTSTRFAERVDESNKSTNSGPYRFR